jgi:hypothetical protein
MGEEVGTMQFRVQGEQLKNDERIKKKNMSIKKRKKIKKKICMRKEKIYMSL